MKIFSGFITGLFLFFVGPVADLHNHHDSLKYHMAVFLSRFTLTLLLMLRVITVLIRIFRST